MHIILIQEYIAHFHIAKGGDRETTRLLAEFSELNLEQDINRYITPPVGIWRIDKHSPASCVPIVSQAYKLAISLLVSFYVTNSQCPPHLVPPATSIWRWPIVQGS